MQKKNAINLHFLLRNILTAFIVFFLLSFVIMLSMVVINASRLDNPSPADVIIVLGARVEKDGKPTPLLERRLNRAKQLYDDAFAPVIIVAGAQGADEPVTEALAMQQYLVELGIPDEAIFLEDQSYNTIESLKNAKDIMASAGMKTALVVSSDYHLWRALSMCSDIGIEATGAGAQNALTWPVAVKNCVRETLSWMKYILTMWL